MRRVGPHGYGEVQELRTSKAESLWCLKLCPERIAELVQEDERTLNCWERESDEESGVGSSHAEEERVSSFDSTGERNHPPASAISDEVKSSDLAEGNPRPSGGLGLLSPLRTSVLDFD